MSRPPQVRTWLSFRVGRRLVAVPVASIRQICPLAWVAPTVGAPAHVVGLLSAAGRTTTVVDAARLLRLPPRVAQLGHALLILAEDIGPQPSALWVDTVCDIVELQGGDLEPSATYAPPLAQSPGGPADDEADFGLLSQSLLGQIRIGHEWCHLLDAELLLSGPWREGPDDAWLSAFAELPAEHREILMARAGNLAEVPAATAKTAPWVAFGVAGEQFALPLMQLLEALACPTLYPVADPLPAARNLANYRGEPLLVAELRRMVGAEPLAAPQQGSLMVVRDGDEKLGLLVDEVLQVLEIDPSDARDVAAVPWICGVASVEGGTIGLVDLRALLSDAKLGVRAG